VGVPGQQALSNLFGPTKLLNGHKVFDPPLYAGDVVGLWGRGSGWMVV
jgi:hypothetical protein